MSSTERLDAIRSQIEGALDELFAGCARVAVLQYPLDANVGNHLMWLGFVEYLRRRDITLAYGAHSADLDVGALRRAISDGDPIVFLGGVTVSRLWPDHAAAKRTIAREFPDNRLVSLPATVMFLDADDRDAAGEIFGAHSDVVLLARDPVSTANAREAFPATVDVRCLHDMGLLVRARPARATAAVPVLWQHRHDSEGVDAPVPAGVPTFDWTWRVWRSTTTGSALLLAAAGLSRLRRVTPRGRATAAVNRGIGALYGAASRAIIEHGARTLDGGAVIVTDRLHTHVLAGLRGQPVVLMPDRFGKNRAVYDYSTSDIAGVHWADTPAAAHELASSLAVGVAR